MIKLLSLPVSLILILSACAPKAPQKTLLKAEEFAGKMQELAHGELIDVRTENEFKSGHIEGANNMPWENGSLTGELSEIDKETPLFVYCLSGGRSASAAKNLRSKGYTAVYGNKKKF